MNQSQQIMADMGEAGLNFQVGDKVKVDPRATTKMGDSDHAKKVKKLAADGTVLTVKNTKPLTVGDSKMELEIARERLVKA